jgi:hypothetical protein
MLERVEGSVKTGLLRRREVTPTTLAQRMPKLSSFLFITVGARKPEFLPQRPRLLPARIGGPLKNRRLCPSRMAVLPAAGGGGDFHGCARNQRPVNPQILLRIHGPVFPPVQHGGHLIDPISPHNVAIFKNTTAMTASFQQRDPSQGKLLRHGSCAGLPPPSCREGRDVSRCRGL